MRMRVMMQAPIFACGFEKAPVAYSQPRMHQFTRNIQALIAKAGGQEELADAIDVSQSAISRWNKGVLPREREKMEAVAKYAGVSVDHIFSLPLDQPAAPLPAISGPAVMLPVLLPNEETLTRMFETSLGTLVAADRLDEIARTLAQRLPVDLQHALSPVPARVRDEALSRAAAAPTGAKRRRRDQPESRT